jgi:hypothetical protein
MVAARLHRWRGGERRAIGQAQDALQMRPSAAHAQDLTACHHARNGRRSQGADGDLQGGHQDGEALRDAGRKTYRLVQHGADEAPLHWVAEPTGDLCIRQTHGRACLRCWRNQSAIAPPRAPRTTGAQKSPRWRGPAPATAKKGHSRGRATRPIVGGSELCVPLSPGTHRPHASSLQHHLCGARQRHPP